MCCSAADSEIPLNDFSRFTNLMVQRARGEFLVLLNNDTEVLYPDWLEHLRVALRLVVVHRHPDGACLLHRLGDRVATVLASAWPSEAGPPCPATRSA